MKKSHQISVTTFIIDPDVFRLESLPHNCSEKLVISQIINDVL